MTFAIPMRDEFSTKTMNTLAKRVGYLCSNPLHRVPTVGPGQLDSTVINVGVAAHISAAATRGPRYDPHLTAEQRRSPASGIWLCQTCAKLIDSDPIKYTVSLLRTWKAAAEEAAYSRLASVPLSTRVPLKPWTEVADRVDELIQQSTSLFVGRNAGMAVLDDFTRSNASGLLIVTGTAGIGKTALLANWLVQNRSRGSRIAYHFFTLRYTVRRTLSSAYVDILRQLYAYRGVVDDCLPSSESDLRSSLYTMIQELNATAENPVIILLDALDEASEIMPPPYKDSLPNHVFFIVSGRAAEGENPPMCEGG